MVLKAPPGADIGMFDWFPPTSSGSEAVVSSLRSGKALVELKPPPYPFLALRLQASVWALPLPCGGRDCGEHAPRKSSTALPAMPGMCSGLHSAELSVWNLSS